MAVRFYVGSWVDSALKFLPNGITVASSNDRWHTATIIQGGKVIMPNNNKRQGTVGDQGQMPGDGGHGMGTNRKQNTGSVNHDSHRGQGAMHDQGMPQNAGRRQSEMGGSDEDDE
jgi:hypothetical protein